jgi:glucose/arabinose dehydrogenase
MNIWNRWWLLVLLAGCQGKPAEHAEDTSVQKDTTAPSKTTEVTLPPPYQTKSVTRYSKVIGWPSGVTPVPAPGFEVTRFAEGLRNPRCLYVTSNGDVLVAEANTEEKGWKKVKDKLNGKSASQHIGLSANRITLLRDRDGDGKPEVQQIFLHGLHQPFGMLEIGNALYVANTDGLMQYPYEAGQTQILSEGKKILDLPAGGYNNHWTRNLATNQNRTKIYISVGSGSDHAEHGMDNEVRRACILEINPDGTGERIFASGLRNPAGIARSPETGALWAVVNERDELGDELVPDYFTEVKDGAFYGWPYAYFGQNKDPRIDEKAQRTDLIAKAIVPDVPLEAHSASLGLTFYDKTNFPAKYHNGAFIGQHGSWNKSTLEGYKVKFVPFKDGHPSGPPEDFLTGFIADVDKNEVYGRPIGLAVLPDGSLLVADDASNTIWRVTVKR